MHRHVVGRGCQLGLETTQVALGIREVCAIVVGSSTATSWDNKSLFVLLVSQILKPIHVLIWVLSILVRGSIGVVLVGIHLLVIA